MTTYKILRFYRGNKKSKTICSGLTLEEAQKHCSREDTHKFDKNGNITWFDGYHEEK